MAERMTELLPYILKEIVALPDRIRNDLQVASEITAYKAEIINDIMHRRACKPSFYGHWVDWDRTCELQLEILLVVNRCFVAPALCALANALKNFGNDKRDILFAREQVFRLLCPNLNTFQQADPLRSVAPPIHVDCPPPNYMSGIQMSNSTGSATTGSPNSFEHPANITHHHYRPPTPAPKPQKQTVYVNIDEDSSFARSALFAPFEVKTLEPNSDTQLSIIVMTECTRQSEQKILERLSQVPKITSKIVLVCLYSRTAAPDGETVVRHLKSRGANEVIHIQGIFGTVSQGHGVEPTQQIDKPGEIIQTITRILNPKN